jgi:hypothetical protein
MAACGTTSRFRARAARATFSLLSLSGTMRSAWLPTLTSLCLVPPELGPPGTSNDVSWIALWGLLVGTTPPCG